MKSDDAIGSPDFIHFKPYDNKSSVLLFFGRTYGFVLQKYMKSFNGNLHTKEYLRFNQRPFIFNGLIFDFLI